MPQTGKPAPQYVVQHEFDDEPTYVVRSSDKQLEVEDCIALGSRLPVSLRLKLARYVCDELNRFAEGQHIDSDPASIERTSVISLAAGQSTIVFSVAGGVVHDLFAPPAAPRVILVDWDTEACDEGANLVHSIDAGGKPVFAWVVEMPTSEVPAGGCDVSRALAAAGIVLDASASSPGIRDPATLSLGQLVNIVRKTQALFYLDILDDREFWNPDKEWHGADLLDELALLLDQYHLAPPRISEAPL
ncbi:MAG: hypothetical protein WD851_12200 [Pirellulales bacterium]